MCGTLRFLAYASQFRAKPDMHPPPQQRRKNRPPAPHTARRFDEISQWTDTTKIQKLAEYMRAEGFETTAQIALQRLKELVSEPNWFLGPPSRT